MTLNPIVGIFLHEVKCESLKENIRVGWAKRSEAQQNRNSKKRWASLCSAQPTFYVGLNPRQIGAAFGRQHAFAHQPNIHFASAFTAIRNGPNYQALPALRVAC
jgi:hypothetical protein